MVWSNIDELEPSFSKEELNSYLEHYGVKGMRWGVITKDKKNTNSSSSQEPKEKSRKEKKLEKKVSDLQKKIDDLDSKKSSNPLINRANENIKQSYKKEQDAAKRDLSYVKEGKLTPGQKRALKGAAIAVGIVATYATYNSLQSGSLRTKVEDGKAFLTRSGVAKWKKNPELAKDLSAIELQKLNFQINDSSKRFLSGKSLGPLGRNMNCRRCTFAYELRRRGYDVKASRTSNARGQNLIGLTNALSPGQKVRRTGGISVATRAFREAMSEKKTGPITEAAKRATSGESVFGIGKNVKADPSVDRDVYRAIFQSIAKNNPERARGELGIQWTKGGAHSVAWEIIGGKVHVFDAQTGSRYSSPRDLRTAIQKLGIDINAAEFIRLDNLPLNEEYLRRWVV